MKKTSFSKPVGINAALDLYTVLLNFILRKCISLSFAIIKKKYENRNAGVIQLETKVVHSLSYKRFIVCNDNIDCFNLSSIRISR